MNGNQQNRVVPLLLVAGVVLTVVAVNAAVSPAPHVYAARSCNHKCPTCGWVCDGDANHASKGSNTDKQHHCSNPDCGRTW